MRIISCQPNHICLVVVCACALFVVVVVVFIRRLLPTSKQCATLYTQCRIPNILIIIYIRADSIRLVFAVPDEQFFTIISTFFPHFNCKWPFHIRQFHVHIFQFLCVNLLRNAREKSTDFYRIKQNKQCNLLNIKFPDQKKKLTTTTAAFGSNMGPAWTTALWGHSTSWHNAHNETDKKTCSILKTLLILYQMNVYHFYFAM